VALLAWSRRPTIPVAATRRTLSGDSSTVARRKRASTIRGELAIGRGSSRHNLVFGRARGGLTMRQSCASAAKLRGGGPILRNGVKPWSASGDRHLGSSSETDDIL